MSIPANRVAELLEDYRRLKDVFAEIDHKYSPTYNEITLDFPESLGLEYLEFTPRTESQLRELAEQAVEPRHVDKVTSATKSYQTSLRHYQYSIDLYDAKHRQKVVEIYKKYGVDVDALCRKLANNGLWYSSVRFDAVGKLLEQTQAAESDSLQATNDKKAAVQAKIDALEESYQQQLEALEERRLAEIEKVMQEMREKDERNRISVEKYNQSVDEKEAKYQASCQRALEYARQAEYKRALNAAKIYAQIGESGVRRQILTEKLEYCKRAFSAYRREEALYLMGYDSFLSAQLGEYYSTLVTWVNSTLPA